MDLHCGLSTLSNLRKPELEFFHGYPVSINIVDFFLILTFTKLPLDSHALRNPASFAFVFLFLARYCSKRNDLGRID